MRVRFARWWLQPVPRIYVAGLFVVICVVLGLYFAQVSQVQTAATTAKNVAARQAHDEQVGCVIQARGLPAGHALARSMADIHALLTFPPTPAQKAQRHLIPPKELYNELWVVKDLNRSLDKYSRLEARQPKSRVC